MVKLRNNEFIDPMLGTRDQRSFTWNNRVGTAYPLPSLDRPPPFRVRKPRRSLLHLLLPWHRRVGPPVGAPFGLPEAEDLTQKSQSPAALLVAPFETPEATSVSATAQPHGLRQPLVGHHSGALGGDGLRQEQGAVGSTEGRVVQGASSSSTAAAVRASREPEASAQLHQCSQRSPSASFFLVFPNQKSSFSSAVSIYLLRWDSMKIVFLSNFFCLFSWGRAIRSGGSLARFSWRDEQGGLHRFLTTM